MGTDKLTMTDKRPFNGRVEIRLPDDSVSDTELTLEALPETSQHHHLSTIGNGEDRLRFLHRQPPTPTLRAPTPFSWTSPSPRRSGHEILADMRQDPSPHSWQLRLCPAHLAVASPHSNFYPCTFSAWLLTRYENC
jgi:hypothetical protein